MYALILTLTTFTPSSRADFSSPPMANSERPNVVLPQHDGAHQRTPTSIIAAGEARRYSPTENTVPVADRPRQTLVGQGHVLLIGQQQRESPDRQQPGERHDERLQIASGYGNPLDESNHRANGHGGHQRCHGVHPGLHQLRHNHPGERRHRTHREVDPPGDDEVGHADDDDPDEGRALQHARQVGSTQEAVEGDACRDHAHQQGERWPEDLTGLGSRAEPHQDRL